MFTWFSPDLFEAYRSLGIRYQRDRERKTSNHLWTENEDGLLKGFIDKFTNNWDLIAECFNGCRRAIAGDRRTAQECYERWREKWPPISETKAKLLEPSAIIKTSLPLDQDMLPSHSTTNQILTRGVKRMSNASAPPQGNSSPHALESDAKRRRRHAAVQEGMRRAVKRRAEQAHRNQAAGKSFLW
jgi:chromatin modification-related protein VID21